MIIVLDRELGLETVRLTAVILIVVVTMATGSSIEMTAHSRNKRSLFQMCQMIRAYTKRPCMDYNNYGCYCGLGNADSQPVDAVDSCCQAHDHCFGNVDCFWLYPQLVTYSFLCQQNGCQCTDSPWYACAFTTCQCDLKLAQCLGRSRFSPRYSGYNRQACHMQDSSEISDNDIPE